MNTVAKLFYWFEIVSILLSDENSRNNLLILDLDETLIGTVDFIGSDAWFCKEQEEIKKNARNRRFYTLEDLIEYNNAHLSSYRYELVDDKIPIYLKELANCHDIYILTARDIGTRVDTEKQIEELGLTKYIKSIIYCDGRHKGQCLQEALDMDKYDTINFVDDKQYNIDAVIDIFPRVRGFGLNLRPKAKLFLLKSSRDIG